MRSILIAGFLMLVTLYVLVFVVFGVVVEPGYMGVRQISLGPWQGFREEALPPGLQSQLPGYSTVHFVPQTVQVLHLHRSNKKYPSSLGALDIQTTDGAKVQVDVTLFTRFYSGPGEEDGLSHGGPADLLKQVGLTQKEWFNRVRRNADDALRRALGKLSTAEFYDPFKREKQVAEGHRYMNENLARFGMKVDSVLVRRYTYEAEAINDAIFRKNLQDQEERLNNTLTRFAEVGAELRQKEADYDARIKTLQIQGESQSEVIHSEGELYEQKKRAEGELAVAKAKAEVDRLRALVLAKNLGSEVYVARELAPILGLLKGGVVTGLDPYNLEEWVARLGVTSGPSRGAAEEEITRKFFSSAKGQGSGKSNGEKETSQLAPSDSGGEQ